MEKINFIPNEMLNLIPYFGGDKRELNLFLRQCEYVIDKFKGDEAQNVYVMHAITGRLKDNAAALVSGREDIEDWGHLKELLISYFGDHRSEELILFELDNLKIEPRETYADFYNRIKSIKSTLMSKVNKLPDPAMKQVKTASVEETCLNAFLYNLHLELVRVVRLSKPRTLEEALEIVLDEIKFLERYAAKNNWSSDYIQKVIRPPPQSNFRFGIPHQTGVGSSGVLFGSQANQPSVNATTFNSKPQASSAFGTSNMFSTSSVFGTTATAATPADTYGNKAPAGNPGGISTFVNKPTPPTFGTTTSTGFSFGSPAKPNDNDSKQA